jgi:hypothetical protein
MADYISTTSRNLDPTNRSWVSVVYQTGKSILDSELNLTQSIANQPSMKSIPSGFISDYPVNESEGGFVFYTPTHGSFQANHLVIKPFYVNLSGHEVYISGTNDSNSTGNNYIDLGSPSSPTGTAPDIKRTDFVFLEFWFALVNPATDASGWFRVNTNASLSAGDKVSLNGTSFGGALVELVAGTDFTIGASESETARNIRDAINAVNTLGVNVTATTRGTGFVFLTFDGGTNGNNVVLTSTIAVDASAITVKNPAGGSSGEGVPSANKIYYAGNTQSHSSAHLDDDIIDTTLNEETTRRVQMQYRFRVYSADYNYGTNAGNGVNPKVQPDGFSNTNIFAQGGAGSAQNGYTFSRASDGTFPRNDTGLYYAGDGSEAHATALSTVDGYVYALPVCFAFRRNVGGFDPEEQANNGLLHNHAQTTNSSINEGTQLTIPANKSDRPDGLFSDQIAEIDVLDLRKKVFPRGLDYSAELDRQFGLLLDNNIQTWFMDSSDFNSLANGSGDLTTAPLVCDEIGRSTALSGPNTNNRGAFIRNFDKVTNRFSDAPVLSRLVLEVYPDGTNNHQTAITVAGTNANKWYEDATITIDLTELESSSNFRFWSDQGAGVDLDLDQVFPTGTKVIDVLECWHDEGNHHLVASQEAFFSTVTGLGSNTITLKLDRNLTEVTGGIDLGLTDPNDPTSFITYKMVGNASGNVGSPRRLFITLLVEYPAKEGLNATPVIIPTPDSEVYSTGSVIEYKTAQRATDSVAIPPLIFFREGVREVSLERVVSSITESFVTATGTTLKVPWKVHVDDSNSYTPTLTDSTNANASITLNLTGSKLGTTDSELSWVAPFGGQRLVSLVSYPRAPVSNSGANGYQVGVYYRARASQTFGAKNAPLNLPTEVTVKPIKTSEKLWSIQSGSSTSEDSYPYASPSVQIGVHPDVGDYTSEADLMGSTRMVIEDISINSGLMALSSVLPMDTTGNITFSTPALDGENRVVYKTVSSGYKPNSFSQSLDESVLHKNALPFLARVESSSVGDNEVHFRNGEIVLVVISKISELPYKSGQDSRKNNVLFSTENRTVACIYKTKDLILSGV